MRQRGSIQTDPLDKGKHIIRVGFTLAGDRKVHTETFYGSLTAAKKQRDKIIAQIDGGKIATGMNTLNDAIERWLEVQNGSIKESTERTYRDYHRGYIKDGIGPRRLKAVTTPMLNDFYGQLNAKGFAPSTIHKVGQIISASLTLAVNEGQINANPAFGTKKPKAKRPDKKRPEDDEVTAIIQAGFGEFFELGLFLTLSSTTGARPQELCALTWGDIDFDQAMIRIEHAVSRRLSGHHIGPTKTEDVRDVPLTDRCLSLLKSRKEQVEEIFGEAKPDDFVFRHAKQGSYWDPNWVSKKFAHCRKAAKIEREYGLYDLRKYVASKLHSEGVDTSTIARMLGNSEVTLLKHYTVSNLDSVREAVKKLN